MAMFKVNGNKGQGMLEGVTHTRRLKRLPPSQYRQVGPEKVLPLKEEQDFV